MRFTSLTMVVTLRCVAQCAHCATASSPERPETIRGEVAAKAIENASQLRLPIVLSGGEPLLQFQLVIDLARRASSHNVSLAVYSNGYWAATHTQASAIIGCLVQAGVNTLLLSTDVYHLPFVSETTVETAAQAAVS